MTKPIRRIATEAQEQRALFEWIHYEEAVHPELALCYHIPNEAKRSYALAAELKREGMKAGVPDICLPVPTKSYHGLYIEMKRRKGGRVSDAQYGWIATLNRMGYYAVVCRGWEEARDVILKYLRT